MSTSVEYNSLFADAIQNMLFFRETLGFSKITYTYELKDFDRFCIENYPLENKLTKNLIFEWSIKRPNEKANNHRVRLSALRQLSKYMTFLGYEAYIIPTDIIEKPEVYEPYLFTDDELHTFFRTIDTIPTSLKSSFSEYTLPVFFRIAYGCGLRPNELFNLRRCDVNLKEQSIFVYNSKSKRDRIIVLTDDLIGLCSKYDKIAQQYFPDRHWFFHIDAQTKSRTSWFEYRMKKYWEKAGLDIRLGRCARIYDFRHNYATRTFMRWFDDGKDIMALTPYLSTYMGHVELHSTLYYIHLLPECIRNNKTFDWNKFETLLPEVLHEE